ncbi:hypothetical protein ABC974_08745 [Sphingomonas oligophenolica]|uniref:Tyr recombinase domain-containing protein n=1 Tax=Sphingomonas oligophenolica TaxID=301154 RepID=A0ABU9Y1N3_9SPHN
MFRFAIVDGKAMHDPSADIAEAQPKPKPKRKPEKHYARIKALGMPVFYSRLAKDGGHELTPLALRWTMLTIVRTQETRYALKDELEGIDGATPQWRISPERMKMSNEHIVPLSRQAMALLPRILELSGDSKWLFPMPGSKKGASPKTACSIACTGLATRALRRFTGFEGSRRRCSMKKPAWTRGARQYVDGMLTGSSANLPMSSRMKCGTPTTLPNGSAPGGACYNDGPIGWTHRRLPG